MKTALVTGGTGFTGSYVVPLLLELGWQVNCFVRPSSDKRVLAGCPVKWVAGDLDDAASLREALEPVDVLINIASLGFGHAPNIVGAALATGLQRALFISTTAIFTSLNAPSKAVRLAAEKTIAESGLDYSILRPTMIYGTSRDRNMCRLIRYLKRRPIIPIIGRGENLQQPVYVKDLARAVVNAVSTDRTIGKAYNLAGARAVTFNQIIDIVSERLKRKILKVYFPDRPVVAVLSALERRGVHFPIKAEQLLRLNEDKAFDISEAMNDFGFSPRSFENGIGEEIKAMASAGLLRSVPV